MNKKRWTVETILEDAKRYKTRFEWQKRSKSAYNAAFKLKILDQACEHMGPGQKKWTTEEIIEDAKKYSTKSEWKLNSPNIYFAAQRKKIIDKASAHMVLLKKEWTDADLMDDAKKYATRKEWQIKSPTCYSLARQRGLLEISCKHMDYAGGIRWTEEMILEDAKKYNSIAEWRKKSNSYSAAKRRGLIKKASAHMLKYKKQPIKWTKDAVLYTASLYKCKGEWQKNNPGSYHAARNMGILKQAAAHMTETRKKVWTTEEILVRAKEFSTIKEWANACAGSYMAAHRKKIIDKASAHMGIPKNKKITVEKILEDAKKYQTKADWKRKASSTYKAAYSRKIMPVASAHMVKTKPVPVKWTEEAVLEDAKKYKSRIEWKAKSSGYKAAQRMGILEKASAHMSYYGSTSRPEQEILKLIKERYKKAHTLRDRKVFIPEKPHISGFDIDIYIPELRKGIEFNGKYWHSVEGLKRSRSHWPEHDLENYHLLKREHFNKKGIKILYINEKEWLEDPRSCLNRIEEFLLESQS